MRESPASFENLKKNISREKKIIEELVSLSTHARESGTAEERRLISSQITDLKASLKKTSRDVLGALEKISLVKPLQQTAPLSSVSSQTAPVITTPAQPVTLPAQPAVSMGKVSKKDFSAVGLEKLTLKRLKVKKKKEIKKKEKKPSLYVKISNIIR